jgi:YVTN family beta-propeller protein
VHGGRVRAAHRQLRGCVGDSVSYIDTATGRIHNGLLAVGGEVRSIAISPNGKRLYAADRTSGFIDVIDTAADKVADSIRPGCPEPITIALSRDGNRLYTGCESSNVVVVNDTAFGSAIGQPLVVGSRPSSTVISPDGSRLYVATIDGDHVKIATIDTATNRPTGTPITAGTWLLRSTSSTAISPTG